MTDALREFVAAHSRLFVLTGAGCSTGSGIPDYRDADGEWKRGRPVLLQDFLRDEHWRRRYWARSLVGWRRMHAALPNDAHRALAALEAGGRVLELVTQYANPRAAGASIRGAGPSRCPSACSLRCRTPRR